MIISLADRPTGSLEVTAQVRTHVRAWALGTRTIKGQNPDSNPDDLAPVSLGDRTWLLLAVAPWPYSDR